MHTRALTRVLLLICLSAFAPALPAQTAASVSADPIVPGPKPPGAPAEWNEFLGIYGRGEDSVILLENDGKLFWRDSRVGQVSIHYLGDGGRFKFSERTERRDDCFSIGREPDSKQSYLAICLGKRLPRIDAGADPANFFHVNPVRPVPELRPEALKLSPPQESGPFRNPDLVELATFDPTIHLDIRYAKSNNFLSTPVYTQARAFLQRPAAEALLRALHKLQPLGYGLLIHDAYRPWYVTKIFWDATPPEDKIFVADPQQGSKHNRGCAVDLTLYDLQTGKAVEMPGLYDEMSPRSFPNFPGGTSLQRWYRDLLRRAMESEGFTVNEDEWWHFDYKDWKQYPILNLPFEKINNSDKP